MPGATLLGPVPRLVLTPPWPPTSFATFENRQHLNVAKAILGCAGYLRSGLGRIPQQNLLLSCPVRAPLCAPRPAQRALMAVAHSMIVIGFYVIKHRLPYRDLGADFFDSPPPRTYAPPGDQTAQQPRLQSNCPGGTS